MKSRFSIEKKMYIFVAAVVLFAALGVAALSYMISSTQMERFDKRITRDSAKNYVSLTDRFSASVGIAEFTHGDEDAETVFRRADQLMYEHKQEHKKTR